MARPPAEELAGLPDEALLLKYWRRLFHASIHYHFPTKFVLALKKSLIMSQLNSPNVSAASSVAVLPSDPPTCLLAWRSATDCRRVSNANYNEMGLCRLVQPEKDRDPDKKGFAVLIKVERAEDLDGQPLTLA